MDYIQRVMEFISHRMGKTFEQEGSETTAHSVEGRNAVLEAFRSGTTVDKLYIQEGLKDGVISSIIREAKKKDVIINFVSKDKLDQMSFAKKYQSPQKQQKYLRCPLSEVCI